MYCLLPSGEKEPPATIASGFSHTKCNHRGRSMFWWRFALLEENIKPHVPFTHLCEWKKMGIRHKARSQMSRDRQRVQNEKTSRHSLVDKDVCLSTNHLLSFVDARQKWSLSCNCIPLFAAETLLAIVVVSNPTLMLTDDMASWDMLLRSWLASSECCNAR